MCLRAFGLLPTAACAVIGHASLIASSAGGRRRNRRGLLFGLNANGMRRSCSRMVSAAIYQEVEQLGRIMKGDIGSHFERLFCKRSTSA
jgi:hypothetical protein